MKKNIKRNPLKIKSKGYASLIGLVGMIVISLCIGIFSMQMGKIYTTKCYSQTTADAVANAIASYSSIGSSFDATKAETMYNKMQDLYPDYVLSFDKSMISANHIIIEAEKQVSYPWGDTKNTAFWAPFFGINVESVTSSADVELVPQAQLAKIKSAFPADKTMPITPFIKGEPAKVLTNDYVYLDALLSQFFTEGRNRYRFTGAQPTVYGTMDAYHLLIGDVLTALGYTPHVSGFTGAGSTNGAGTDKPLTDGYIYVGSYKGHDYIITNTQEEAKVTVLYLDETKENGMSKLKVDISEISNLRKSPTKWYSPKNETEKRKKENTTTFF